MISPEGAGGDAPLRAAVFLDRDGTVIHDRHYLGDPAGVELLPGAADAISRMNDAGLVVLLVTNQSGIGRGLYSTEDFHAVQRRLKALLAAAGAHLDGVYLCPHAPDLQPPCECRKPRPGLFLRAAAEHRVDFTRSFFVGDRSRDVEASATLGGTAVLVTADAAERERAAERGADAVQVKSLAEAADWILPQLRRIDSGC